MKPIILSDNTSKHAKNLSQREFKNLWSVANRPLKDLAEKNERFLVYPPDIKESKDRIGDRPIFNIAEHDWPGDSKECHISTGNLMGFFRCGSDGMEPTEVHIRSRFTPSSQNGSAEDCGKDWFLPYMLNRVLNFNILSSETSRRDDSLFDLLVLLFPKYLMDACQKGLFRQYVVHNYNDSRVRGAIDVSRHIRFNVPFAGRIAYRTREYSCDNAVTQLVRHTIEFIRRHQYAAVLNAPDVAEYVHQICEATPSYAPNDRRKVLDMNRKNVAHPYLWEYSDLQKLCRMILMFDESNFGVDQDEVISGVLFDGAWLWEEYLNVVLEEGGVGLVHARNKTGGGAIHPLVKEDKDLGLFYPDFYRDTQVAGGKEIPGFVMDAKYKRLEGANPHADDLQQVIAYMHVLKAGAGVYLYPREGAQNNSRLLGELRGYGGELYTYGLYIPSGCGTFADFAERIKKQEKYFVGFVKNFL